MDNTAGVIAALKARFGVAKPAGNGWVRIPCPLCDPHHRKKLKRYVSLRGTSLYNKCFICEQPMSKEQLVGSELVITNDSTPFQVEQRAERPDARVMPGTRFIPVNQLDYSHPAIQFLQKDHLFEFDRYYNDYGIVYCPSDSGKVFRSRDPFVSSADRLVFPVVFRHEMVGWQMRSIPGTVYGDRPDVVKYYHLFNKGQYLYSYDQAKQFSVVVLVEGVKKALKIPNAVASLGKGVTQTQVQLLAEWDNIIVCLDAGEAEQHTSADIVSALEGFGKRAISVDLSKYNVPSPDEITSDHFTLILTKEWYARYGTGSLRADSHGGQQPL